MKYLKLAISSQNRLWHTRLLGIEFKYFNTADYKKFISQTLDAKIKQKGLLDKSAIAVFVINVDLDKKNVATLATKS